MRSPPPGWLPAGAVLSSRRPLPGPRKPPAFRRQRRHTGSLSCVASICPSRRKFSACKACDRTGLQLDTPENLPVLRSLAFLTCTKSPLSRNKLFVGSGFQDMDIFAACSSGFCPTARIPSQSNSELGKSEFFLPHPPKALIEPSLCAGNSLNVWNRNRNADTTKKKK